MNKTRERGKMLGVVLVMMVVGMTACPGLAVIQVPPGEAGKIVLNTETGVYEVVGDLNEGIVIDANGVTLDGGGFMVTGPGYGDGVKIVDKTNVVVTDLTVTGFSQGIYVSNSSIPIADHVGGHHLIGNTVNNNSLYGISIMRSNSNIIEGNDANSNDEGIRLNTYCSDNIIIDNTLNSNVVRGILLNAYCHYNYVMRNVISDNGCGIQLFSSTGNEIYNNDFINNATHVYGQYSYNNILSMDPPIGGNYWDDWSGNDNDGDGLIDDNPRTLTVGTDEYPMVVAYSDRMLMLIENIIDFFDDGVATNGITARGRTPETRLSAFRSMLEDAQAEILLGEYGAPCPCLADAMDNCDGEKRDLIIGPDVPELFIMIENLTIVLGCE